MLVQTLVVAKNLLDLCGPGVLVGLLGIEQLQVGSQSLQLITDRSPKLIPEVVGAFFADVLAIGSKAEVLFRTAIEALVLCVLGLRNPALQGLALSLHAGPYLLLGAVADLGPAEQPKGCGVMRAVFHGEGAIRTTEGLATQLLAGFRIHLGVLDLFVLQLAAGAGGIQLDAKLVVNL